MGESTDLVPVPGRPVVLPGVEEKPGQDYSPLGVVGIGASAGGLAALSTLLGGIPENTGLAFVIIQHLDPNWPSHLPDDEFCCLLCPFLPKLLMDFFLFLTICAEDR